VLAAVGVFGVTAHVVARRRRELGIRLAIGARPGDVVRMTVAQAALPVLGGAALGLLGALATTKLLAQFLYATTPTDPATFALVLSVVITTSLAAAYFPALRTRRIDPVQILRLD
jgi:ABC-type antimicrobial peptide transport system permease subunit